jgi:nucleoside-diphosphate-sugar epimerase
MAKYLITGVSGFVAKHFLDWLNAQNESAEVLGLDLQPPDFDNPWPHLSCRYQQMNLLQRENLDAAIDTEPLKSKLKNKFSSLEYIDLRYGNKVYDKFK